MRVSDVRSKVIIGQTCSGKSAYLKQEAERFLAENQDGELYVCDLFGEYGTTINSSDGYLKAIAHIHSILRDRVANGKRRNMPSGTLCERPILLICDDFHRFVSPLTSAERDDVREAIELIAFEGRKYLVGVILAAQPVLSLKKLIGDLIEQVHLP